MFGLTLVDHLRLTFGHVIHTHRAHSRLALTHARWNRALQGAEALLLLGAAVAAIALASTGSAAYGLTAGALAAAAVFTLIVRLIFDFDRSASAHRVCSARLWHIREQYRALLTDLADESLSLETARARRDTLMGMLHAIYESAPPAERGMYEASQADLTAADEEAARAEVNQFLPQPVQKEHPTP
jgi:hypothetical protein